jgi:hypothetical protein
MDSTDPDDEREYHLIRSFGSEQLNFHSSETAKCGAIKKPDSIKVNSVCSIAEWKGNRTASGKIRAPGERNGCNSRANSKALLTKYFN